MKCFTIELWVGYNEESVPYDMREQLKDNVFRCVSRAELLNDSNLKAIVSDWGVEVEARRID